MQFHCFVSKSSNWTAAAGTINVSLAKQFGTISQRRSSSKWSRAYGIRDQFLQLVAGLESVNYYIILLDPQLMVLEVVLLEFVLKISSCALEQMIEKYPSEAHSF